jgi:hypothetical protein
LATLTPYRLLPEDTRLMLVIHDLKANSGSRAAYIMRIVAKGGGFRPETQRKLKPEQLARDIVRRKLETLQDEIGYLPRASTEEMRIRMEGLRRDYPQYYAQIVSQINRCFRWTGGGRWNTVIRFEIQRDGTIPGSSIQFYARSGNGTFDIQAFGAVECAGAGRLSPLPEDVPYDALPVQFTFSPA